MGYLLGCLKKEKERTAAFQALGLLVVAVRAEIQPYLSKVLEIIKAALPPKDFAHKYVLKRSSLRTPQMMLLHIQILTHLICYVVFFLMLESYCLTCLLLIQCLHVHLLTLRRVRSNDGVA